MQSQLLQFCPQRYTFFSRCARKIAPKCDFSGVVCKVYDVEAGEFCGRNRKVHLKMSKLCQVLSQPFQEWRQLYQESNLKKRHFLQVRRRVGVLSVFSRSSVGEIRQGIREVKEMAILIKVLFYVWEFFSRSLVLLWFLLGLQQGVYIDGTREQNLKKSTIYKKDIDRIVMSYRCPIDVLWCFRNTRDVYHTSLVLVSGLLGQSMVQCKPRDSLRSRAWRVIK